MFKLMAKMIPSCFRNPRGLVRVLLAVLAGANAGCTHLGPKSVATDRFDYSSAIADSWKQQTLLNIVKVRYLDLPVFVDVSSIVAGYSLQTGVNVNGTLSGPNAVQGDFLTAGGQAVYTDRPTVTYVPMTGEKFLRGLVNPIDPKNIFFLLQSGYPADFILALTVESLNGVRNRSNVAGMTREADPEFVEAVRLIREVQGAGAVGVRVEQNESKNQTAVVFFRRENLPPEIVAKTGRIRQLLRLPDGMERFKLSYSPVAGATNELAVNSRSMLQIMTAFGSYVEVPSVDLEEQRALPGIAANAPDSEAPVRIRSGQDKPKRPFAAVHYRDHWFWIDDSDWKTKRALTAVMFFFTLADTGGNENLPLITIPAQ